MVCYDVASAERSELRAAKPHTEHRSQYFASGVLRCWLQVAVAGILHCGGALLVVGCWLLVVGVGVGVAGCGLCVVGYH